MRGTCNKKAFIKYRNQWIVLLKLVSQSSSLTLEQATVVLISSTKWPKKNLWRREETNGPVRYNTKNLSPN
jgi:hypothetical protein